MYNIRSSKLLALALFLILFTACSPVQRRGTTADTVFLPPTPADTNNTITQIPATATAVQSGQPSPTAPCQDNLYFRADVTIPDGTPVQAASTLDKRWEVENTGSCNWQDNYRVRLIAGPDMSAQPEQALYPARSGTRAVIRIVFKAPSESGSYRSAWQAFDPQGEPFGDPFFIEVLVE